MTTKARIDFFMVMLLPMLMAIPIKTRYIPPYIALAQIRRKAQSLRAPGASRSNRLSNPTWIWIRRDLLDDALVPRNADLDQNTDPEVAQRGRNLDAWQAA
jgi:hypothetical protein